MTSPLTIMVLIQTQEATKVYVVESFNDGELQNVKIVHQRNDGTYFYESRNERNYEVVNVNAKEVYTIERNYRQSKSIKRMKRMIVRFKHNCSNSYIPYIGVIYSNKLLDSDDVEIFAHGNPKSADASPYTRKSQKTLEREKTLLTEGHSVEETYDLLIKESVGPYTSSSQSTEPRNKRQLYNVNLKRQRESEPNDADDVRGGLSSLLTL